MLDAWNEALRGTAYEGALHAASYTGNMRAVLVGSGLFTWEPMNFIAQRGDIYLNEEHHTAMCVSAVPDMLAEFLSNEFHGATGGEPGDQTGGESVVRAYWDFPWDGILHYTGAADGDGDGGTGGEPEEADEPAAGPSPDIDALARAVINGEYGNGDERRAALGDLYGEVQARVNEMLGGGVSEPQADAGLDIDALARAVINGDYGNGDERRERLGDLYAAVQAKVNEMLA